MSAPTTYYCQWPTCGKHFDTFAMLPTWCPACGREAFWETIPPAFDHCLTQSDREWLKRKGIGDPGSLQTSS